MSPETAAAPAQGLKFKNIEVALIDGLIVAGTLFLDRLKPWQRLEPPLTTAEEIRQAAIAPSPFIPVLALATAVVMVYAMARKSKPENPLLQVFYAIGLMGIMWTCGGITTLLFNSVIMFLPGMLFGYVVALKHEGGDSGLFAFVNRVYDNASRIIILPVALYIFVSGMEYLMLTAMAPAFAVICVVMLYLPIRMMIMFKEPYRWYHFISMTAAFAVFAHGTITMISNSPAAPVWDKIGGYLGDRVRLIEESDGSAVVYANVARSMGRYAGTTFFIVEKNSSGRWEATEQMDTQKYLERIEAGSDKVPAAGK